MILHSTEFYHKYLKVYVKNTTDQEIMQFLSLSSPALLPPTFFVGDRGPLEAVPAAAVTAAAVAADCCRLAQANASFGT
jgi:hypothetical protein